MNTKFQANQSHSEAAQTSSAHKLARILWAMVKHRRPHDPTRLGNPELARARRERYLRRKSRGTPHGFIGSEAYRFSTLKTSNHGFQTANPNGEEVKTYYVSIDVILKQRQEISSHLVTATPAPPSATQRQSDLAPAKAIF